MSCVILFFLSLKETGGRKRM